MQTRICSPLFLFRLVWLLILLLIVVSARAEDAGTGSDPALVAAINAALDTPSLRPGFQGVVVRSLKTNEILYERNADHVFLPASNNKLLTSAAAFGVLLPSFTYHTKLYAHGNLGRDGTLYGDLILVGAGDPTLTPADLENLAKQAQSAGVRRVTGHLEYNDTFFDAQPLGESWNWDDEPFDYSAQVSALDCNENVVEITVAPGRKIGAKPAVSVAPTAHYVSLLNTATTVAPSGKTALTITRRRGLNAITVSGTIPLGSAPNKTTLTVEEPSRFTTQILADKLRAAHIGINAKTFPALPAIPPGAAPIAEHDSRPLADLLALMNKPSDNLIAECLLKTVGAVAKGQGTAGTSGTGAQSARAFFRSAGLDVAGLSQSDGSGLSRLNYVSPRTLVALLAMLSSHVDFSVFNASLPIAGVDGTLRNRMKGTAAEKNVHAKTGSLSHVSSLSGYVTTKDGEPLAFSILMNNHLGPARDATQAQDTIAILLANYVRSK